MASDEFQHLRERGFTRESVFLCPAEQVGEMATRIPPYQKPVAQGQA